MDHSGQIIKIYIINLKNSIERREEMIRKMEAAGLGYEFFEAVDGKQISPDILSDIKAQPYSFKNAFGREMTLGEIGCAMSHLLLYKKIVHEQVPLALILEDDIDFDDRLQFVVRSQATADILRNKLDLVLLGFCTNDQIYTKRAELSWHKRSRVGNNIVFGIPTTWYWSTIGYFISGSGAAKLSAPGMIPRMPSDFLTANSPKYKVRLGISNTPLVWPGVMNDLSHIGGGRGNPKEIRNANAQVDTDSLTRRNQPVDFITGFKQVYRNTRSRYHKIKRMIYKHYVRIIPSDYKYVSEKF